jgi:hypothetical protein
MKIVKRNLEILAAAAMLALAMLVFAYADGGFRFFGPVRRLVSPNGLNNAIFCFDNPSQSGVLGAIYTMLGAHVTDLGSTQTVTSTAGTSCPEGSLPGSAQYLSWDGKVNGAAVHSGVYVYQIRAEGQNFSGALLVVR